MSRRKPQARRIHRKPGGHPARPDTPLAAPPELRAEGKFSACLRLMRLDRPVGIWLLAWPTFWSLWLAAGGTPGLANLITFSLGVVLMRSAGCVVNDLADQGFDAQVRRTRLRPLVTGALSRREAWLLLLGLLLLAALLLPLLNRLTQALALVALLLALSYPLAKRWTWLPQLHLGIAFGMSVPMAWAAENGGLAPVAGLLFIANVLWSLAYDTLYALADREDDLRAGVRSTAILFGDLDTFIIGVIQVMTLITLALAGGRAGLGLAYHLSLLIAAGLFAWQQFLARDRNPERCIAAFRNNQWVGAVVFVGIVLGLP